MLPEGLYYLLSHDSNVLALVGTSRSDNTTGIFPSLAPREVTLPYVVFGQIVGGSPANSFDGRNQFQEARYRFRCYAADYKTAKRLAEAVKLALDGLLTTLNDGTRVEGAQYILEADQVEPALRGTIYGTNVDFMIRYVDLTTVP
jgi:hypothetical protein